MDKCIVKHRIRYFLAFLLVGTLCYMFPYTGDDWAWGSIIGINRWNTQFADYGGRYLGYVIVMLLTRSRIARAIVMSVSYLVIASCIEYITRITWSFYLTMTLIAFLPRTILRQAVVWTAGFSNYVTSTVIMMIIITYLYAHFDKRKEAAMAEKYHVLFPIFMFLLGLSGTLIVEHVTCYIVLLSVTASVFFIITEKSLHLPMIALTSGSVIGSIMMFSNGAYHKVAANQDGYRTAMEGGLLASITKNYISVIFCEGFLCNRCLNLVIFLACLFVYEKMRRRKKSVPVAWLSLGWICIYLIISIVATMKWDMVSKNNTIRILLGVLTLVYLIALMLYTCWVGYCDLHCIIKLLFPLFSIGIVVAPLFVVNPIGSRCFFPTYVLFILYSQLMISSVTSVEKFSVPGKWKKLNFALLIIASIMGYLRLVSIYYPVFISDNSRLEHIKEQITNGKQIIEVEHLPYEEYLWTSMPYNGSVWEERYKLFYGLPVELDFVELTYDEMP